MEWYRKAAAQGSAAAAFNLGFAYQNGLGVNANVKQAAIWYERAARAGSAEAGNNLGILVLSVSVGAARYAAGQGLARPHRGLRIRFDQRRDRRKPGCNAA